MQQLCDFIYPRKCAMKRHNVLSAKIVSLHIPKKHSSDTVPLYIYFNRCTDCTHLNSPFKNIKAILSLQIFVKRLIDKIERLVPVRGSKGRHFNHLWSAHFNQGRIVQAIDYMIPEKKYGTYLHGIMCADWINQQWILANFPEKDRKGVQLFVSAVLFSITYLQENYLKYKKVTISQWPKWAGK